MQRTFGGPTVTNSNRLNCTANDIAIARAVSASPDSCTAGDFFDLTATFGQFNGPRGVATDGSGNVYVADRGNFRIQKFDANGTFLATWGSSGSGNGQFPGPTAAATDASGNIYVADQSNNRIQKFACP